MKQRAGKEIYYYLRGEATGRPPKGMKKEKQNGPPLITVCIRQLPDGKICRGVAICSGKDIPNKKEGRRVARNYMLKAAGVKKTDIRIKRMGILPLIWNTTKEIFPFHSYYDEFPNSVETKILRKLEG